MDIRMRIVNGANSVEKYDELLLNFEFVYQYFIIMDIFLCLLLCDNNYIFGF